MLLHYAKKLNVSRPTSTKFNLLTIVIERKLAAKFSSIPRLLTSRPKNINPGDLAYLDRGDLGFAVRHWSDEFRRVLDELDKHESITKLPLSQRTQHFLRVAGLKQRASVLVHKIFYACLVNCELDRVLEFVETNLASSRDDFNKFSLFQSFFK